MTLITDEEMCKMDLYLFINVTPQATKAEIKKAFKVKARAVHPDKNPDPKAGELFDRLRTIYNFLDDDKKREMYDKYRQQQDLRKRKLEEEDSGRRNLRKELERREEAFRVSKLQENKLSDAEKARLQTEKMIEEMMKHGVLPSSQASVHVSSRSKSSASSGASSAAATATAPTASSCSSFSDPRGTLFKAGASRGSSGSASATASTTVVIAWELKRAKDWEVELRLMLEKYGKVGDLIVKKKKALAVFASASQAAAAVASNQSHPELKFKLKPMLLVDDEPSSPVPQAPATVFSPSPSHYDEDYEAQTLQLLLRRQQEKHV